ncbi:MAG: Ig-like domain-containing protein [Mogibacterium sp.]|nr:Ig-like domain-containing protein [Mogibacterium sp.]
MKLGRTRSKGFLPLIVMGVMMVIFIMSADIVMAAQPVRIWDSEGDSHRINKVLVLGVSKEATISYKLDKITEVSHLWSVDDPNICEIEEDEEGKLSITGIKEGLTRLRLSVVATDEKTYTDYTVISVYTPTEGAEGVTNKSTVATRSAHSGTENKNIRATVPAGTGINVFGKCGDYYRGTVSFNFDDDNDSTAAFILASDITIPVVSISLDKTSLKIGRTQRERLRATVTPSIATNNAVTWKSSNPDVVSVKDNGVLTGISDGTAVIEATADGKTASCKVTVEGEYVHTPLCLSTSYEAIDIGETVRLSAMTGVADTYVSSNSGVATVGDDGTIEGISPGDVYITVTSLYDEKAICSISVKYPNSPKVSYKKAENGKYTLSWKRVSNVSGYQVYKYNSKKKEYKKYKTIKSPKKQKLSVKKGKYQVRSYKKNRNGKTYYSAFTVAKESKETSAKYKIVFVGNGGTGEKYTQTVDFNKKTRLKANKFNRDGYAFVGWSKSPNGEVVLKNKSTTKKLTNKKKIKLYAIWRSDRDPNGKVQRQALLCADSNHPQDKTTFQKDIIQMKTVYESANFDGSKIKVEEYGDKSPSQIKNKLESIGKNTTKNDVTYLHISCHGGASGYVAIQGHNTISGAELREWLDDYVDGTVVITMSACHSGRTLRAIVAGSQDAVNMGLEEFVKQFEAAGTGAAALAKNGKYKILTSAGDGYGWFYRGYPTEAVKYWSKGLGYDYDTGSRIMYADGVGKDNLGKDCYGNQDGKVTLNELYQYAKPILYELIVEQSIKGNDPVPYQKNVPQVYPQGDEFVIYQK